MRGRAPDPDRQRHRATKALLVLLWAHPLFWLAGVNALGWILVTIPAAAWFVRRRTPVVAPRGFGVWLLFLGWVLVSALAVSGLDRAAAAMYRLACYAAAALLLLLVVNAGERYLTTRSVVMALTALWSWSIGLAVVGLLVAGWSTTSLLEMVLPARVDSVPFIRALIHPALSTVDPLLGVRPRPLFPYTNNWGSAVALLTPVAAYAMVTARSRGGRFLLAMALMLSVVPVVASFNRGLWLSLTVGVLYVTARLAMRGRLNSLLVLFGVTVVLGVALVASPLGDLVVQRFENPNTSTRETLYAASIDAAAASPVIGYGAPVSSKGLADSNEVSVGTHGQFWTVLVSQGVPGAVLFVGFLVLMVVRTWSVPDPMLWLHAVPVVLLAQLPYYDPLPAGLCVTFLSIALCLRARPSGPVAQGSRSGTLVRRASR